MNKDKRYSMIQIESELHEQLKKFCKENGMTLGGLVSILIRRYLKNKI